MKNVKIASTFIIISISILLFTACNSMKSPTNTTKKAILPTATKTIYSDTLKGLVTAKTITQTQSDKVMEDATKNVSQVKGSINRLGTLVENRVITQIQADKINQEIEKGMKGIEGK
ncbi:hypothetical protein KTC92_02575 [Clostridium sp. CM027]|uniref:hypothetical protein n=1 Tax=Clostridium sp. CM027 TaxID=2849865 RepID=UPI001C6E89BE|nr:hypothetical protein [Clostridium sp. CM027]MBW9145751.1 hypothetical protein [Clostridium sp. CM027]UVE41402.1 hypothetical protein KTC92_02575 [Clostridium sp. CM027]